MYKCCTGCRTGIVAAMAYNRLMLTCINTFLKTPCFRCNLNNTTIRVAALALALASLAPAPAIAANPGAAPDCARLSSAQTAAQLPAADAALLAALPPLTSPQASRLLGAVGVDIAWWLRKQGNLNLSSVPTAFHEANHVIDVDLAACNQGKAVYVFGGATYVTELVRGATTPYVVAAAAVPPAFKTGNSARYQTYMLRTPKVAANDFTTLLDELNAYVGAAEMEVALADSPLYGRFRAEGNAALDGNIGGTADLMLYVLSYLKTVRQSYPASYAKIRNSPLLLAHLQRLWTASEAMLKAAGPLSSDKGGLYVYPIAALVAVDSPPFIGELDRLGIRHAR